MEAIIREENITNYRKEALTTEKWRELKREPVEVVKKNHFINASGRSLWNFPEGTYETADANFDRVIKWRMIEPSESMSAEEIRDMAYADGKEILDRNPGATVLCQSSWGYTLALAKYINTHGGRAVYVRTNDLTIDQVRDGNRGQHFTKFADFVFPEINTQFPIRDWNPGQVLLNFTSHRHKYWTPEMCRYYDRYKVMDVANVKFLDFHDLEDVRLDCEAYAKYVAIYSDASEAIVMGEWSYVATIVPVLISYGITPYYAVKGIVGYNENNSPIYGFLGYREYCL